MPLNRTCTVPECERVHYAREWCYLHYLRWRRHGTTAAPERIKLTTLQRFFDFVDIGDGCWEWKGYRNPAGYGVFNVTKHHPMLAHRFSRALFYDDLDAALTIDHLCCNPPCVNPDHLDQVTQRENILRGTSPAALNARKEACINGHPFIEATTGRHATPYGTARHCLTCREEFNRRRRVTQ